MCPKKLDTGEKEVEKEKKGTRWNSWGMRVKDGNGRMLKERKMLKKTGRMLWEAMIVEHQEKATVTGLGMKEIEGH